MVYGKETFYEFFQKLFEQNFSEGVLISYKWIKPLFTVDNGITFYIIRMVKCTID